MSSSENILHVSPERPIRRSMCAFGQFRERPVGKLPWRHVCTLLDQVKDPAVRDWYADRDARNGWLVPPRTRTSCRNGATSADRGRAQ